MYVINEFINKAKLFFRKGHICTVDELRSGGTIRESVFVGARSVILPDVKIGNNVIIGAGSVVTKSIPDGCVALGVPCRVVSKYEDYVEKIKNEFKVAPKYDTYWKYKDSEQKNSMKNELSVGKIGFDP